MPEEPDVMESPREDRAASEHNHLLVQPEIAVDKPSHSHHKSILFTSCIDCNSIHLELIIESHIFLLIKVSHGDFQLV